MRSIAAATSKISSNEAEIIEFYPADSGFMMQTFTLNEHWRVHDNESHLLGENNRFLFIAG